MTISISDPTARAAAIFERARALGFDASGVAPADVPETWRDRLEAFVDAGRQGDMHWMKERRAERASPSILWPLARSVIMLGVNYAPKGDPMARLARRDRGVISVYAWNRDYHDVVKKRLKALARWMVDTFGGEVKVFVDTAPVMEKPLAQRAGVGWQGKHTNLVSRDWGSWLFLGAIYSSLAIEFSEGEKDHCGQCTRCLEICPTDAFPAPYQLDARRCISYLTIEHKGPIPRQFRAAIGNRIYGCDDCLAVCPWNKFARASAETAFHARDALDSPMLAKLAKLDDRTFRNLFSGSPIKRTGRARFVRNVMIAIGNSGDPALAAVAADALEDASPLVRGAAVWALSQLLPSEKFNTLADRFSPKEIEESVRAEWTAAG